MTARRIVSIACTLFALNGSAIAADAVKPPFFIELFTALGCSSCPPADEILTFLARRPDTVALAFHVNYWDSSWVDRFAIPASKSRQEKYRAAFRNAQVYTPQMVIDGAVELPGNNGPAIVQALARASEKKLPAPALKLARHDNLLSIGIEASSARGEIWLAVFDPTHTEEVKRGENRGRTIINVNIVRELRAIGKYTGAAASTDIDLGTGVSADQGVAVFVQPAPIGPVITAAILAPNQ